MTEPIKINCEEVLEACLNKTKITTIRKAYQRDRIQPELVSFVDKPAKWKVGDVCDVVWTGMQKIILLIMDNEFNDLELPGFDSDENYILGRVEIISVEKIKFWKSEGEYYHTPLKQYPHSSLLAEDEGFDSPEDMFKYIEYYSGGLDTPKPFWLITWRWI